MAGAKTSIWDKRKMKPFRIAKRKSKPNISLRLRNVISNVLDFRVIPIIPIRARCVMKKRL